MAYLLACARDQASALPALTSLILTTSFKVDEDSYPCLLTRDLRISNMPSDTQLAGGRAEI